MHAPAERRPRPATIALAATGCLCLGVGLLVWGLAPCLIQKLGSGRLPGLETIRLDALVFALGVAFVGLHTLVGQQVRWAVWTALLLSAVLSASGLAFTTLGGLRMTGLLLVLLSAWACVGTWLTLFSLPRDRSRPAGS